MQVVRYLDDPREVLIRWLQKIHTKAKEVLAEHRAEHQASILWRFHKGHIVVLFRLLDNTEFVSTSIDKFT